MLGEHGRTGRRLVIWVLAAAVGAVAVPRGAGAEPETARRLEDARRQLQGARSGLSEADRQVDDARQALAAIQAELNVDTQELQRLEDDLAESQRAYAAAEGRTQEVDRRLQEVNAQLQQLENENAEQQQRLDQHAAVAYMRGGTVRTGALYSALLGSNDLHEMSLGMKAMESTLERDQDLVQRARWLASATERARGELSALHSQRLSEQASAQAARDRSQTLADRQAQLISQVGAERDRRAEILDRTRNDHDQADALVHQLEELSAELSAQLAWEAGSFDDLPFDGPMPLWADRLPDNGRQWAPAIASAAGRAGIDPRLFAALVWTESSFQPGAVSRSGAVGLCQLTPETAAMLGVDPRDPLDNLAGGARYLAQLLASYDSLSRALVAYNVGPGSASGDGSEFPETQFFVLEVLTYYKLLSAY